MNPVEPKWEDAFVSFTQTLIEESAALYQEIVASSPSEREYAERVRSTSVRALAREEVSFLLGSRERMDDDHAAVAEEMKLGHEQAYYRIVQAGVRALNRSMMKVAMCRWARNNVAATTNARYILDSAPRDYLSVEIFALSWAEQAGVEPRCFDQQAVNDAFLDAHGMKGVIDELVDQELTR